MAWTMAPIWPKVHSTPFSGHAPVRENTCDSFLWQVSPIQSYPVSEVNERSYRILENHKLSFPAEKQLQQVFL